MCGKDGVGAFDDISIKPDMCVFLVLVLHNFHEVFW